MRIALITSVGAALLSTSIALFVVLDDEDSSEHPELVRSAAAATMQSSEAEHEARTEPTVPAATVPTSAPAPNASSPTPAPTPVQWPDLMLDALPPLGSAPEHMGQSLGSPRDGALLAPTQLPNARDYLIRDENTAWGTENTLEHLRTAIRSVRRRHPALHRLVIGDLSTQRGGPLPGHTSHQSGRDVDVGLWSRGRPEYAAPTDFVEANRDNLDRRATYDLIAAFAATRDDPTGVELIVLDYGLQRLLRRSAAARGVEEATLEALFQYPHGPTSRHGLVRHKPAHRDHMHVRFRCPQGDSHCRSPLIGFAGMEAPQPRPKPPPEL